MDIWQTLKIRPTQDARLIRRAFAERIKSVHPSEYPKQFDRLHEAYEEAIDRIGSSTLPDVDRVIKNHKQNHRQHADNNTSDQGTTTPHGQFAPDDIDAEMTNPNDAIYRHISEILSRVNYESQNSAIHYLREILKTPELNEVIPRATFERVLQKSLIFLLPFPEQLASEASIIFNWQAKLQQPHDCYLAAVQFLILHERAYDKIDELEALAKKGFSTEGKLARALLGDYRPWHFRRLLLRESVFRKAREWITEFKQHYPHFFTHILDSRTIQWWENAVARPRLFLKHYLTIFFTSTILLGFILAFNKALALSYSKSQGVLIAIVVSIFFFVWATTYIAVTARYRYGKDWPEKSRDYLKNNIDWYSLKSSGHALLLVLMFTCFSLTVLFDNVLMPVFALAGYVLFFVIFRPTLFFYINFVALMVGFLYKDHEWAKVLVFHSVFKLHTFAVAEICLVFVILKFLIRALGNVMNLSNNTARPEVEGGRHLYELFLMTCVFIAHIIILNA